MSVDFDHRGRWQDILTALGVEPRWLVNKHGPCPFCGGKDRYRFDDKDGRGTWFCSHCGSDDGFGFLMRMRGIGFSAASELVRGVVGECRIRVQSKDDQAALLAKVKETWQSAKPWRNSPVYNYLFARRVNRGPWRDIRYLSGNPHSMVALVRAPSGNVATLHRTFLRPDGSAKADIASPRKMSSGLSLPKGSAVRLCEPGETLGIAEGLETAMSACLLFGIPVWSALNASNLAAWTPPEGVARVVIFADNDKSWTGQQAAYTLAQKLTPQFECSMKIPPTLGDWNDQLMAQAQEQAA